jgi:hypothetical protein
MSTNTKGKKVIPYKIKKADIVEAEISDVDNVCRKRRAQEISRTTNPEPFASITENPYKVFEF